MNTGPAMSMRDCHANAKNLEPHASKASGVLSYAILLGGVITIGVAVYMVMVTYSSLPYADGWIQISAVARGGNALSLAWLWQQHNEHRLVIPKLFLAADLHLFKATQTFLLASILAIQFLHWMLLSWSMRVLGGWRGAIWRTGAGLAAFCLFCPTQVENFVCGFQVCFVLPGLFATLSFVGLLLYWTNTDERSGERRSWKFLLLSIMAAVGATYSLSNGNLLWPLLVAASLLLRLGLSAVLSFTIAGTISTGLYLHRYISPPQHASPLSSIETPLRVLKYLAVYFGSSCVRSGAGYDIRLAALIGVVGFAFALLVLFRLPFYVRNSSAFEVLLALTLLYCLGTGFLTALGRLNFGYEQAFATRYQTVALPFWCCLGLMVLRSAARIGGTRVPFVVAQICLLAIMVRGATLAHYPIRQAKWHGFQMHAATAALLAGVDDLVQLQQAYPPANYLLDVVPYMRDKRLSIFSGRGSSTLGKPLDSMFRLAPAQDCTGVLDSATTVDSVESHLRITGWAWDNQHGQPASEIVATTNGIVTGLGAVGQQRPDITAANLWMSSSYIGYAGYIRDLQGSTPVQIYAVLSGSPPSACHFTTIESQVQR